MLLMAFLLRLFYLCELCVLCGSIEGKRLE